MRRFAAFLRGINVAGRRVGGEQLCAALETVAGVAGADAFLASGNVVFDYSGRRRPASLAAALEAAIEARLGFRSSAFLRSDEELLELAALEPFSPQQLAHSDGKPQVVLYDEPPSAGARKAVLALASAEDALAVGPRELHWLPSGGISDSELDLNAIERELGTGTQRTKNTIDRIAKKYFG